MSSKWKWGTRYYKTERYRLTHCFLFYNFCRYLGTFPSVISGRRRVPWLGPPLTTLITATPTVRSRTCVPTRYRGALLGPSGLVTMTWFHIKGKSGKRKKVPIQNKPTKKWHPLWLPTVHLQKYKKTNFEIAKSPWQKHLHRWVM